MFHPMPMRFSGLAAGALLIVAASVPTLLRAHGDDEELLLGLSLLEDPVLGEVKHRAANFARNDINAAGGHLRFIDGNLDEDFFHPTKDPAEHLRAMANQGVRGIIGPTISATAVSIHAVLGERNLVAISPAVASDGLSDLNAAQPPGERRFFRTIPHNSLQAIILADLVEDSDEVLIVYRNDGPEGYGRDLTDHIRDALLGKGRPAPMTVGYTPFRFEDADADRKARSFVQEQLESLPGIGALDAVILVGFTEAGKVAHYMLESALVPDQVRYYASDGLAHNDLYPFVRSQEDDLQDPQTRSRLQARVRGFQGVTPFPHSFMAGCGWEKRFADTDVEGLLYTTHTYDATVVMALASLRADSTDPSLFAAEVAGVTRGGAKCTSYAECRVLLEADPNADIDYDGLSGPLELDEFGDVTDGFFLIYTYDGRGGSTHITKEISGSGIQEVPNRCDPPELVRALPRLQLSASGGALTLDLPPFFYDPDNSADGALTFAARSSDPALATVAVAYGALTLTPNPERRQGEATIHVRATDTDGLSIEATFPLTVTSAPSDDPELLIGLSLNENATLAEIWHQAAEFAKDDINSVGGNVRFIDGDLDEDYFNPAKDPVAHLQELVDLGVKGIVGPIASPAAISILDFLSSRRLVAISPVANADRISELNAARPLSERYFFRTAPHNSLHAKILEDLTRLDGDPVLVVYRDDDYGRDLAAHIGMEMTKDGRPPPIAVAYEPFRVGIDPDADRKAEDFVRGSIDALPEIGKVNSIIVIGFPAEGKVIAYLLRSQQVPKDANYYVSVGLAFNNLYRFVHDENEDLSNPQTKAAVQARIEGFKGVAPFPHSHVPGCSWERRFPGVDLQRTLYTTHIYDAVVVMALASLKAGSTEPSVFAAEVAGVTRGGAKCLSYAECRALLQAAPRADIDYDGLSGPLELDDLGDLTDGLFTIYTYDGQGRSTHIVEEISESGIRILPNHCERPEQVKTFPPLQLSALGDAQTLDLSAFFSDADDPAGRALTYAAWSSDPTLAMATVADGQLTLTTNEDFREGETIIRVRATDATGFSIEAAFTLRVSSERSWIRPWWLRVLSDAD